MAELQLGEGQLTVEECEIFQAAIYSWFEEFAQENLIKEKMREMREEKEGKNFSLRMNLEEQVFSRIFGLASLR